MSKGRIAIVSDHAGVRLKGELCRALRAAGREVADLGTEGDASVDYPDYADALVRAIEEGRAERGVAICGSGIGMSIALNRHRGIRGALCHDAEAARLARAHNNANVIALGARSIERDAALACVEMFLETDFEGGRHQRRVAKLS